MPACPLLAKGLDRIGHLAAERLPVVRAEKGVVVPLPKFHRRQPGRDQALGDLGGGRTGFFARQRQQVAVIVEPLAKLLEEDGGDKLAVRSDNARVSPSLRGAEHPWSPYLRTPQHQAPVLDSEKTHRGSASTDRTHVRSYCRLVPQCAHP
jgi:hypothetical protein